MFDLGAVQLLFNVHQFGGATLPQVQFLQWAPAPLQHWLTRFVVSQCFLHLVCPVDHGSCEQNKWGIKCRCTRKTIYAMCKPCSFNFYLTNNLWVAFSTLTESVKMQKKEWPALPSSLSTICLSLLASSGLNCRHSTGIFRTVLPSSLYTSSFPK